VLEVQIVFEGTSCDGPIKDVSQPLLAQYCHGGINGSTVNCIAAKGSLEGNHVGLTTVEAAIPFLLGFDSPININCGPNSENDWDFTVFGDGQLDVTLINPDSLTVAPAAGGAASQANCRDPQTGAPRLVGSNLECKVAACPLGDALDLVTTTTSGPVDVQVNGLLSGQGGLAIQGITTVQFNGGNPDP
jgi:hypothetical protein